MTEITNYKTLGDLLSRRKFATGKTYGQIRKELGITSAPLWHEAASLPEAESLPTIAKVYEVSLEELTAAYKLAKEAREREKSRRKSPKSRRKGGVEAELYRVIKKRQTLISSGPQLSNWRLR